MKSMDTTRQDLIAEAQRRHALARARTALAQAHKLYVAADERTAAIAARIVKSGQDPVTSTRLEGEYALLVELRLSYEAAELAVRALELA